MIARGVGLMPFAVACVSGLFFAGLVVLRVVRDGIQMYGCDGAPYIEHVARLRVLKAFREGSLLQPFDLLVSADGAFPPLLHLASLPFSALVGHQAEYVLLSGPVWLLLTALAIGSVARSLSGDALVGVVAFIAALMLPALHGFATRYYYDLPMATFIWWSTALFLAHADCRPVRAGLFAGLMMSAAALVKWSALPFGLPLLLGSALCESSTAPALPLHARLRRRLPALLAALALVGLVSGLFLWSSGPENSYRTMQAESFESAPPASPMPAALEQALPELVSFPLRELWAGLQRPQGERFRFYVLSSISSVYSPLLAGLLAVLVGWWLLRDRRGWPLLLVTGLGTLAFLLLVLPVLDERFVLVAAPAPVIVAALGWRRLPDLLRVLVALLALSCGAAVALDFHFGSPAVWNEQRELMAATDRLPPVRIRGLGLASSVKQLGWVRHDEQADSQQAYREALWQRLKGCRFGRLAELDGRPILGGCGNRFWWDYRADLDALRLLGPGRLDFQGGGVWSPADTGYGERGSHGPELLLLGPDPARAELGLPAPLVAEDWVQFGEVADPLGSTRTVLLGRHDADPCDEREVDSLSPPEP
ncbi:MAG: hypothetical protein CMP23_12445 [Rickettsiales bacterium]|nr:hypothetical protein [Rickettsiales bacterium]